jgi:phosphomannomutase
MNNLPPRFTSSSKLPEFPNDIAAKIMKKYSPADSEIDKIEFRAEEILITRKDGAEEILKNDSDFGREWQVLKNNLEEKYLSPTGIAKISYFIYTDGLRIGTENKEIIHLRESNNAPELRCYAVADSLERAKELVQTVLTKIVPELKAALE